MTVGWWIFLGVLVAFIVLMSIWHRRTVRRNRRQYETGERQRPTAEARATRRALGVAVLAVFGVLVVIHFIGTYGH